LRSSPNIFKVMKCMSIIKMCERTDNTTIYIYIGADTSKENTRFVSFSINTLIVTRHVSALSSHHQVFVHVKAFLSIEMHC
jgi:hypothetical protein